MKKNHQSDQFQHRCSLGGWSRHFWLFLALASLPLWPAGAVKLKEARVSQVIKDVKLLPNQAAPRPAQVSDQVRDGTAVRTGVESRAELTFTDQTLARLGANTIFSFNDGTRNLDLGGGAMLLRVPKDAGGAQINTAAVTAAITGTTVMLEYHPDAYIKFIILEGTGRIFRKGHLGESVLLHAGQMLVVNPNGKGLPDPVDVDLDRLTKTSLLIVGFPPLPSLNLIAREIGSQDVKKNEGGLIQTNLVIFGGGTTVSLLDPTDVTTVDQANSNEARQAIESPTPTPTVAPTETPTPTVTMTMTPTPTPSKTGTPSVISSPVPYVITSGTTIQTDPAITTNGKTDYGKIYRGPTLDGPPSAYLFTATSPFDIALGFDQHFEDVNLLPLAVFKFSALEITGDPTISIPDGGATNLALVSVGDITSGLPGGSLTFTGLDSLLLATQDGSITLTSDLSFENIPALAIYARGLGSNITLDAAISGTTDLFLGAEGNIVANDALTITQTNNGLSFGLFAIVIAGGDITVGNGLSIVNDNSVTGNLLAGGTITLSAGGNLTVNGDGNLTLTVDNSSGGHIGTGGNILVTTGGDLTASAITLLVNDRNGGTIDQGANLTFSVGGAITTTGDATFVTSTRNDGAGGGVIGSDIFLSVNAASVSTGGLVNLAISANAGGNIQNATLNFTVPGDLVATGGVLSEIQSTGFNMVGGPFIEGGMINGNAILNLISGNVTSGDAFDIEIDNDGAGTISGNALMTVTSTGNITGQTDAFFNIVNTAALSGNTLIAGGTIGGDAVIAVNVAGEINTVGLTDLVLFDNDSQLLDEAGSVVGNATISLTASGVTTGSYFQPAIDNRNGSIGGDALISVGISGDINAGAGVFHNILNSGGAIGLTAASTLSAVNITSGDVFELEIFNDAASIGATASLVANLSGSLVSTGDSFIQINNQGGAIGGDALINFNAASFTAPDLYTLIENDGGTIAGNASIAMNVSGNATFTGNAFFEIFGSDAAASATINLNGGNYDAGATFLGLIDGDGAITFNNATVHADVLKVGALGANGVLNIGGGTLSADTTLKLYAPGSNGQLNFVSNVTLGGTGAKSLAANTITISNNVVVTIGGTTPADVYTGFNGNIPNANYTGFGGNGSTTGTFAGAGANTPQPLANAPPFDGPVNAATTVTSGSNITNRKRTGAMVHVSSTDQLLALLDAAAPDAGGKIVIPASKSTSNLRKSGRTDAVGHLNADRRAAVQTSSLFPARRLP